MTMPMPTQHDVIRRHYQAAIDDRDALLRDLGRALEAVDVPLTAERLATLDQFHVGGLAATAELARRAGLRPDTTRPDATRPDAPRPGGFGSDLRVLDAGSGLGGPSRYLAETFGCRVDGVDLAPDYVAVATLLAERAGVADRVHYQAGDVAALPFPDARFDLVWTQHVVMNVRDRVGLYREFRRVLAPGGRLACYDPIAADGAPTPYFPVPWAATAETSTLLTARDTVAALEAAGFAVAAWDDVTEAALGWMAPPVNAAPAGPGPGALHPALHIASVVGPRAGALVANFGRNLREGRVRLVMGVCDVARPTAPGTAAPRPQHLSA